MLTCCRAVKKQGTRRDHDRERKRKRRMVGQVVQTVLVRVMSRPFNTNPDPNHRLKMTPSLLNIDMYRFATARLKGMIAVLDLILTYERPMQKRLSDLSVE